jgi:hypothetical protein
MMPLPKLSIHVVHEPHVSMIGLIQTTGVLQEKLIGLVCDKTKKMKALLSPEMVGISWHESRRPNIIPMRKSVFIEVTLTKLPGLPDPSVFADEFLSRLKEVVSTDKMSIVVSVTYVEASIAC